MGAVSSGGDKQVLRTSGLTKRLGSAVALWLCAAAVAFALAGLRGLRRRDLGDLGPSYGGGRFHDWLVDYLQIRAP